MSDNTQSPENVIASGTSQGHRIDFLLITQMVKPGSKVLDVGCGNGELLGLLGEMNDVDGRGIEISQSGVNKCVARGLSVIQGDADQDLSDYPSDAFDYVILSQTLQATRQPRKVLEQMLRIGRHAIVSFPNFGNWRVRSSLFFGGRMPVNENLPHSWFDTPNIHFCTIDDFLALCAKLNVTVVRAVALKTNGQKMKFGHSRFVNLLGAQAIFLLRR